jgi:CRP-like cAMP-binding protein
MAVQLELLKSTPYFAGLNQAELDSVSSVIFEKTADRGEIILSEGEPSEAWYIIASGAVKAFVTSPEGKEQTLKIMRPGESFNDAPIFGDGPSLCTAQAMGPVVLCKINRDDLKSILKKHPQVALNANKVLAEKVRQLASLIADLSFCPVICRVAKMLLENTDESAPPHPRLTQQEIAAMVGTAREVVGRSLKALEGEGAIKLERNRLIITSREVLKEIIATHSSKY